MDIDKSFGNKTLESNELAPANAAVEEVQQTWSFAPASQSRSQQPGISFGTTKTYNRTADRVQSFASVHRSLGVSDQGTDEDGLLRARRHDLHKSGRLLDAKRDKGERDIGAGLKGSEPTHIPVPSSSFGDHKPEAIQPRVFRHSASRSSRSADISDSLKRRLSSQHEQDFSATPNYHTPTKPRKTLHERLQGRSPVQSQLFDSSGHPNQWRSYLSSPGVKPEQTVFHLPPAPAIPDTFKVNTTPELGNSEGRATPLDPKHGGPEIIARSRSASVSSTSVDAKGMQSMVMEAMRSIQRYESENEMQKGEIERLSARVVLLGKEKDQLDKQVNLVKSTSVQKLAVSAQSLEALRVDLAILKADSQMITPITLADVKEMKATIAEALKASEMYLHQDKEDADVPGFGRRTREIITDLQLDCTNKQQVLDMLRDRLTDTVSDLATSKTRVLELEAAYAGDRLALKNTTGELVATKSRACDLAFALRQQQTESLNAIASAGNLEMCLEQSKTEVSRLGDLIRDYESHVIATESLETHVSQLQSLVDDQKAELMSLEGTTRENVKLKTELKEREDRLKALEEGLSQLEAIKKSNVKLETRLEEWDNRLKIGDAELSRVIAAKESAMISNVQLKTQLDERGAKLKLIESEIASKSSHVDDLRICLGKLQANLENSEQSVRNIEEELASSRASEASEKAQRLEATREKTLTEQRLATAEQRLENLVAQAENRQKCLEETNTRFKSMQERFEEQTITLRLTRDTTAELQDRFITAESGYAKNLEASCGRLRTEIAVLQEQNASLQIQLKQSKSDAEEQRLTSTTQEAVLLQRIEDIRKEFGASRNVFCADIAVLREQNISWQTQLKQSNLDRERQRLEFTSKEATLLQRIEDTRKDLDREVHQGTNMKVQSDAELAEARRQLVDLQSRLEGLQTQLRAVPASCAVHELEIENLQARIMRTGSEHEALRERARSLNDRYDRGDLDAEERSLLKKIMEATQSMHDGELAQAQNELRRRDNLISTLQDAKATLENSLAKHLEAEAKIKMATAKSGTSVMDFVNWPSSQSDLSSVPPAQDKDEPSTIQDDSPAQEDTAQTPLRVHHQAPDSPDQRLANAIRIPLLSAHTPGSANRNFAVPSAPASKTYFSTLARESSDEIGEFEEEAVGTKRKKNQAAAPAAAKPESSRQDKRPKITTRSETQVHANAEAGTAKTYVSKNKKKRR